MPHPMAVEEAIQVTPSDLGYDPEVCSAVKAIVTDLDGTFLCKGSVHPENAKLYLDIKQKDIMEIIPATGRSLATARNGIESSENMPRGAFKYFPGVYLDGVCVYGRGGEEDIVYAARLRREAVVELLASVQEAVPDEAARLAVIESDYDLEIELSKNASPNVIKSSAVHPYEKGVYCILFFGTDGKAYTIQQNDLVAEAADYGDDPIYVSSLDSVPKGVDFIAAYIACRHSSVVEELRPKLMKTVGKHVHLTSSEPWLLSIVPPDCSKGQGMKILLEHYGMKVDDVMALGDAENDRTMLKLARLPVVMGQAAEGMRASFPYVTAPVDEGGWVKAITEMLRKKGLQI